MVLYHYCNSFALAQVVERQGFEPAELVQVTDVPPETPEQARASCPAMVVLGVPFGFNLDDYPPAGTGPGSQGRLVAGLVLNQFQRAAWPA